MTRRLLKAFFLILTAGILLLSAIPALADGPAEETETKQGTETEQKTEQEEDELYAVVKHTSVGRINLRLGPTAASERVAVLEPGTKAKVLKNLGNWALIEANGFTGYMSTFYLDFYINGKPTTLPAVEVKIIEVPVAANTQTTQTATPRTQTPAHRAGYYDRASWPVVESTTMYVSTANGGSLRLRYQPTTDSAVAGNYPVGTAVTVLNRSDYWAYVNVNGATGFMMLQHLAYTQPSPPAPPAPTPPVGTATVVHPRGSFVNLRSSRTTDTDRNILARVPSGTVVDVLVWDTWYTTITYNGITGYMVTSYLVP